MKRITVVYIAGHGRSGSTLLERMLAQTDSFVSVGELRHMWQRSVVENQLCGCNNAFSDCEFWQPITKEILAQSSIEEILALSHTTDRIRYIPKILFPLKSRSTQRYLDILRNLYSCIDERSGGKIILDSSKDVSTLYLLSQIEEIQLYAIHLVRDARAVAFSWQRKKLRPEVTGKKTYMERVGPSRVATEWMARNALVEIARPFVDHYMRLRYEDFVKDPRTTIQTVLETLGEPVGKLDFITDQGLRLDKMGHTVAGNPMRFRQGQLPIKPDEEWRDNMEKRQKLLVSLMSWIGLARYGYGL